MNQIHWKLFNEDGKEVVVGSSVFKDLVEYEVVTLIPPHGPWSSGKVGVRKLNTDPDSVPAVYYVGVFKLTFDRLGGVL